MATATGLDGRFRVASASLARAKRKHDAEEIEYWSYAIDRLLDAHNDEKRDSVCR